MEKTIEELIIDKEEISDKWIRDDFKNFKNTPYTCLDKKANALDKIVEAFNYSKGICEEFGLKRDCGNPYFIHPYTVAKILYDLGFGVEVVIGGLVHDTLEILRKNDEPRFEEEKKKIESKFGKDILELTLNVSTDFYKGKTYYDKLLKMFDSFNEIKRENKDRETFLRVSALLIKLTDSIDNIKTVYARRKDLYSELPEWDKISKSKNKEADLKIIRHRKMIKNSIHFLKAVNKYIGEEGDNYLKYADPVNILYERFRESLIVQIQNEIGCINLEIKALEKGDSEEYKKAILKGVFGERNSRLLKDYGYDLERIKENICKLKNRMPIEMPRHKYLFDQIAGKEIKKEDLINYKRHFSGVLRDYQKELNEKIEEIKRIPTVTINQSF